MTAPAHEPTPPFPWKTALRNAAAVGAMTALGYGSAYTTAALLQNTKPGKWLQALPPRTRAALAAGAGTAAGTAGAFVLGMQHLANQADQAGAQQKLIDELRAREQGSSKTASVCRTYRMALVAMAAG